MDRKILISIVNFMIFINFSIAQTTCEEISQTKLLDLIEKKYKLNPIQGAKYVFIDSCKFLVSVGITSASSNNLSAMNRIASVKARISILTFLNNPKVTTETILQTEQVTSENNTSYIEKYFDNISEESTGFVNGMETLTAFKSSDGSNYIYVIFKSL